MKHKLFLTLVVCLLFSSQITHAEPTKNPCSSTSNQTETDRTDPSSSSAEEEDDGQLTPDTSHIFTELQDGGTSVIRPDQAPQLNGQEFITAGGIKIKSGERGENLVPRLLLNTGNVNGEIAINEGIILRNSLNLSPAQSLSPEERPQVYFKCLTICYGEVTFENLHIKGKIKVENGSKVNFKNCIVEDIKDTQEISCSVEINSGSSGNFENCTFKGNGLCGVLVDRSNAKFLECTMNRDSDKGTDIVVRSCYAEEMASRKGIQVVKCKFLGSSHNGIQLFQKSRAIVDDCEFIGCRFGVIVLDNSDAEVKKSKFDACHGNNIICKDSSKMRINNCQFNNMESTGVSAINSEIFVADCEFNNTKGNGINLTSSNGEVSKCNFKTFALPAIRLGGHNNSLKISDSLVEGMCNAGNIVVRDKCRAILENIILKGYTSNNPIISCSDFAKMTINNISFEEPEKLAQIMVFNAAKITFENEAPKNRKILCLNYDYNSSYRNMLETESFRRSLNSNNILLVEEKTEGEINLKGISENVLERRAITSEIQIPALLPDKQTQILIGNSCAHPVNICPNCNDICECKIIDGTFIRNCSKCDKEFPSECLCPLCKSQLNGVIRRFKSSDTCIICNDEFADWVAVPCGHVVIGENCVVSCIEHNNGKCPLCRAAGCSCFKKIFL